MNIIKKLTAIVIAFSLVLGTVAVGTIPVMAEEGIKEVNIVPEDVIGTEYAGAVQRLMAFGLIEGYPDGTYRPKTEVNRAEFAKLLIHSLGLEDAAKALQGQSSGFGDVRSDHWASGYINIASSQGLIKGYPDKTFKPEEKVTYAHSLTMLVRALGYNDEYLSGNWPNNYISKAADVNITKGLSLPSESSEGSIRGIVAQLINKTLDAKVIDSEETLLKNKLNISKYEDTRIIEDEILNSDLGKNQIKVKFLEDIDATYNREVKNSYKKNESRVLDSKMDVRRLIGEEVTTYSTNNEEVIYVEIENDDKSYFDYIEDVSGDKVSLVNFGRDYRFSESGDIYVFNKNASEFEHYSGSDIRESELLGRMGKFVVRSNEIVFAEILDTAETNSEFLLVEKNDRGLIQGVSGLEENFNIDLRDNQNYDYSLVYNNHGDAVELKDIREGNLLYIQKHNYQGDNVAYVTVIQDNKIEGTLGDVKNDSVKVGRNNIDVVKIGDNYKSYYKVDEYEGIKTWGNSSLRNDLDKVDGKNAEVFLDGAGRLAYLKAKGESSEYKFGIVTRTYADGDKIRIWTNLENGRGNNNVYKIEKGQDLSSNQKLVGSAVKFRLNSENEVLKDSFKAKPYGSALKMVKGEGFGSDIISASDGKSYVITSDETLVINAPKVLDKAPVDLKGDFGELEGETYGGNNKVNLENFKIETWKDIKNSEYDRDVEFYIWTKDNNKSEVEAIFLIGEGSSEEVALYVLDHWIKGDETLVEYVTYPENKIQTRVLEEVRGSKVVLKENAYIGEERDNGELVLYSEIPKAEEEYFEFRTIKNATVKSVRGDYIKITEEGKSEEVDFYTEGALVYTEKTSKSPSYLKSGDKVNIIKEGNRARVIQLVERP